MSVSLPAIPNVTKLSATVTRVLGQNPGKFTLQGTNTYLIGHAPALLLLDTAQGLPSYIPELRTALQRYGPGTAVTDILLTHWHGDHVDGLPSVLNLLNELKMPPPRMWKFPCSEGDRERDVTVANLLADVPSTSYRSASDQSPFHSLSAGQTLSLPGSPNINLQIIHTPGHTTDSISLFDASNEILYTADTVLGSGTAVFEDLGAYMSSLLSCISLLKGQAKVRLYPGHGEVVENGLAKLEEYHKHRQQREDEVVASLRETTSADGKLSPSTITQGIYRDTIPADLIPAATRGVLLHLEKLEKDGKVTRSATEESAKSPLPGWFDDWCLTEDGRLSKM